MNEKKQQEPACDGAASYVGECANELNCAFSKRLIVA